MRRTEAARGRWTRWAGLWMACGSSVLSGACSAPRAEPEARLAESAATLLEEPPPPPPSAPWSPDEGWGTHSHLGTYWVSILPPVGGFPLNEECDVVLRILDGATRSAVVRDRPLVDARMPAHGHGLKQDVGLVQQADGSWLLKGLLLHMVGHWELYVDLERGALTERAQFDIELE